MYIYVYIFFILAFITVDVMSYDFINLINVDVDVDVECIDMIQTLIKTAVRVFFSGSIYGAAVFVLYRIILPHTCQFANEVAE